VLALWLITSFTRDSNPVVLLFETTGICAGPVLFVFGLCWLFRIVGRRRRVQLGQWVAYPARVAIVRLGPLWWTVVGLEITPTATVVIYPEQLFRSRIRRLVEREGQLLVLVLPPDSPAWFLYAGPSGRPVFAEMARTTGRYGSWQVQEQRDEDERPALAALARARDSAL
jgi:hypothetical protein